jgi:hypothetical protein
MLGKIARHTPDGRDDLPQRCTLDLDRVDAP